MVTVVVPPGVETFTSLSETEHKVTLQLLKGGPLPVKWAGTFDNSSYPHGMAFNYPSDSALPRFKINR